MEKSNQVKERIITAATELIEQSEGETERITMRAIAHRAGVGGGVINYHFQTKERLIAICVQRIIGQVIAAFQPGNPESECAKERLTQRAVQVFDFLFEHPAVSRISILDDLQGGAGDSNTFGTQRGFHQALLKTDLPEEDKSLLCFALTSAMQSAFLWGENASALLGCDLRLPEQRKNCITRLVSMLFNGLNREED